MFECNNNSNNKQQVNLLFVQVFDGQIPKHKKYKNVSLSIYCNYFFKIFDELIKSENAQKCTHV